MKKYLFRVALAVNEMTVKDFADHHRISTAMVYHVLANRRKNIDIEVAIHDLLCIQYCTFKKPILTS